jgi:hypothetical protein
MLSALIHSRIVSPSILQDRYMFRVDIRKKSDLLSTFRLYDKTCEEMILSSNQAHSHVASHAALPN